MVDQTEWDTRIADLEADNRRLRRLLHQHDAPGELRHRLRNTVAMLRTIIRRSADNHRELEAYVGHLEDRLDALMRAQAAADEHGAVDLRTLLEDELLHYGAADGERVSLSGPEIELRPRTGQVMAMAVHELAVNAVEHGVLGGQTGLIAVRWAVSDAASGAELMFVWHETGVSISEPPSREGFGTEVLTRMLPFELRATTSLQFESDGVRYTLRMPFDDRTGTLVG